MKRVFYTILLLALLSLFAACAVATPASAPAAAPATGDGLMVEGQWARAALMKPMDSMAADSMTTTMASPMTETAAMTASTAMTAAAAMSDAAAAPMAAMTATTAMTGTMGMGMDGAMSAIYMTILNPTDQADRLIKAESDAAEVVELHNVAEKDGVMSMFPVEGIDVPAQGQAELKPGSFHVMLIGLTRDLNVGDTVTVTLTFAQAESMTVAAEVRER